MKKENLVILKGTNGTSKGTTIYQPNHYYRSFPDKKGSLIYGEWFDKREVNSLFEPAIDRVLRDWKALGLVTEDYKPISKSLFTKLADIHTYGTGKKALKVWYYRNSRDVIYGFYPMQGNKEANQTEVYQMYLDIVNGNPTPLDDKDVCFGNCGIPLAYGELRIS